MLLIGALGYTTGDGRCGGIGDLCTHHRDCCSYECFPASWKGRGKKICSFSMGPAGGRDTGRELVSAIEEIIDMALAEG